MRVSTRIVLGFAVLVVLAVGPLAYQIVVIHQMQLVNHDLANTNFYAAEDALELKGYAADVAEFSEKHFKVGDPIYERLLKDAIENFNENLGTLETKVRAEKDLVEVDRLIGAWKEYSKQYEAARKQIQPGVIASLPIPFSEAISHLESQTDWTYDVLKLSIREEVTRAERVGASAESLSYTAGAVSLLLAVVVAAFIVSAISKPLQRLTRTTRLIAKGQFWHRIPVGGKDEFSALANHFNIMSERLGELDEMKKGFVSHVSHELKAPLASIRQVVHLMLQEIPGSLNEQQKRLLRLSLNSAERLAAMVGNLLDVSRLEAGTMEYEIDTHDLVEIVRTVAEEFEVQAQQKEVRLRVESNETAAFVECDRDRMIQVVGNLFENALKFSSSNTEILAKVDRTGGRVVLSVSDSGPGVPDGHKDRIFVKFHQVKQGKKLTGQGVGLGLAICKTIVEAHQGTIRVDDNPTGGSIFRVDLRSTAKTEILEPK